ncbi:AAA family ATPase [Methylobrevis albus]|uniref:DNA-binding protein n=1 Tax=Methylobrevis albus TaxID=2793297 RepID=A0A931I002_9HYPH|nr:DNA-binding protein [Methylobrevis albus]MBH0236466.1 DNA-binding protein [Methylobrevis albus]
MKISALRLFNVKRFGGRGVAIEGIGDGVNVLCAVNEHGKSTSFEALHALFFQPHSGTPTDVRNLRPYSGGSPLVEADIETGDGRFRITKQYYGGKFARVTDLATGRLVAQADEAENFIAGLIKGGTAGPAGLLWVRQGITGIEKRKPAEEESEKQVRASLLESVQGEVEAVTGGRRMAEIMAAAEEALGDLVTAGGRPKTGGRYAAALAERDRLAAEEAKLAADVASLRTALDRRAGAVKRLAELDEPVERQARQAAVAKAQAGFEAARAQGEALRTAEAELRLAAERRAGAEQSLKQYRTALLRAEQTRDGLRAAERRRHEALGRRREAAGAIETARAAAEAAEGLEQETRTRLARLDAAERARAALARQGELKSRLAAAAATRAAIEAGEAELPLVRLPPAAIDELQATEIEIAKLRAVEEAARASVTVDYLPGTSTLVTLNGTPLSGGATRSYDGVVELGVPGIGTITLRSNRPARGDDKLAKAEASRRALLASMAVADLAAARARQVRAQEIDGELRERRRQLAQLAPNGLGALREEVEAAAAIDADLLELKEDPVAVRAALAAAEAQRKTARQTLREVEPLQAAAADAFVAAETALAGLKADLVQVDALLGPADERAAREQALAAAFGALDRAFADAEAQAARLRATAVDLDGAEAALKRARSVADAAEKEAGTLRETIAGLNAEIRAKSDEAVEEAWRETADALAAARVRAEAFATEAAVLRRLTTALETARSEARELYLKPVMAELRPLLGLLFDDVAITFDEKTLLPQTILRNGQEEDVERLSGGMREQLSVLTRLAFARLLARDGRPAPVILDDALVYSDDDRIERMFDALHRQSKDQQIIVFSCRQRAFQRLGGHSLSMTDWQPQGG